MLRRLAFLGFAALAFAGCGKKSSPVIAKGDGFTITADDFKARLEEQSPFMRARYNTLERKKEFLENLIRFEVLARAAEEEGLRKDPEVQQTLRRIMVQKLVQKKFAEGGTEAAVPDAEVQKFYDEHGAEYHRPKRVRVSAIAFLAAPGSPERAKKTAAARKALASLQVAEKDPKTQATAFVKAVGELSEDATSKAKNGDLGLLAQEDLAKATSPELAAAAFGMKQGETSGVVETPQGLYILKAMLVQDEVNRTLEQVKPQIVSRLSREKKAKDFEDWMKKLREGAKVAIDDKELDAIPVAAPPQQAAPGGGHEGHAMPAPLSSGDQPGGTVKPASGQAGHEGHNMSGGDGK